MIYVYRLKSLSIFVKLVLVNYLDEDQQELLLQSLEAFKVLDPFEYPFIALTVP